MAVAAYADSDYGTCNFNKDGTKDCIYQGFGFSVIQHGLTQQEIDLLDNIKDQRKNGTYELPPVQIDEPEVLDLSSNLPYLKYQKYLLDQRMLEFLAGLH